MALTSKTAFENIVPVNAGFTDGNSILPFLEQAEENYLVPLIGRAFYDELVAIETPDAAKLKLLTPIYRAVSYTALWLYIPFGNVQISQSGIQIISDTNRKSAFEWQVEKVSAATAKLGMDGFERVLDALESNIDSWPTYKISPARTANSAYFLNTASQFNEAYNIDRSRLTFLCLWPLIREVEETLVLPALGTYAATLKGKEAIALTDTDKQLLAAIKRAIAYTVVKDAIPTLSVELSPAGLSVNFISQSMTQKASTPAPDARLESLKSMAKEKSAEFLALLPTLLPNYVPPANQIYNIDNGCNGIVSLF